VLSDVNIQERANDEADEETQHRHAKTQSSHFKKTPFERHVLGNGDVVLESLD
jgi:hypothetical protein